MKTVIVTGPDGIPHFLTYGDNKHLSELCADASAGLSDVETAPEKHLRKMCGSSKILIRNADVRNEDELVGMCPKCLAYRDAAEERGIPIKLFPVPGPDTILLRLGEAITSQTAVNQYGLAVPSASNTRTLGPLKMNIEIYPSTTLTYAYIAGNACAINYLQTVLVRENRNEGRFTWFHAEYRVSTILSEQPTEMTMEEVRMMRDIGMVSRNVMTISSYHNFLLEVYGVLLLDYVYNRETITKHERWRIYAA